MMSGFKINCIDCSCVWAPREGLPRDKGVLWILGTHHKMGSFLTGDLWKSLRTKVHPPLSMRVSQFAPMRTEDWVKLDAKLNLFITFHAQGVQPSLQNVLGRPYRFIHVFRDPVETLVSAFLYESQRHDPGDKYNKIYQKHSNKDDAFAEIVDYTMEHALRPMMEQYRMAEADPNSLNVRFEDFTENYNMTMRRIFHFLGVPQKLESLFVDTAAAFDIHRPGFNITMAQKRTSEHITAGRYDKGPLLERAASGKHRDELSRMRAELYAA